MPERALTAEASAQESKTTAIWKFNQKVLLAGYKHEAMATA